MLLLYNCCHTCDKTILLLYKGCISYPLVITLELHNTFALPFFFFLGSLTLSWLQLNIQNRLFSVAPPGQKWTPRFKFLYYIPIASMLLVWTNRKNSSKGLSHIVVLDFCISTPASSRHDCFRASTVSLKRVWLWPPRVHRRKEFHVAGNWEPPQLQLPCLHAAAAAGEAATLREAALENLLKVTGLCCCRRNPVFTAAFEGRGELSTHRRVP